ncbi:hypothetical protein HUO14_14145 [Parasphingorhabdus flavimaris]|uniref:Uncharacterized protein n=1 Tax=Parasphingorhabdus flavimaris TaxID=266812 RepID=A0ABX2N5V4_9SPHN|nr:hypothetical protein [Parasphingorhabdus flavimaris]NVD29037.1 hypothetical protein [Parasphingorhabdus flavimaris]|tara:strand:- start:7251 stop:7862 length:612 start_codon:yes stop_codon:yes gene_type:complete
MSESEPKHDDHDHLPIGGRIGHSIERIEYREIIEDGDDGRYSIIGTEECNGDISEAIKLARAAQEKGCFPGSTAASSSTDLPYKDSSCLSIKFEEERCFYVFKLSDDSNLAFDNAEHLFGIRLPKEYGADEISELKGLFSDPCLIAGDKQWAGFVFDGKKARELKDKGMRIAFDIHVADKHKLAVAGGIAHPPYWPPHPPDLY